MMRSSGSLGQFGRHTAIANDIIRAADSLAGGDRLSERDQVVAGQDHLASHGLAWMARSTKR